METSKQILKSFVENNRALAPIVAEAMRRMFDPLYSAIEIFKNKDNARSFLELLVAIELIGILQKKQNAPTNEFLNFFRQRKERNRDHGREILADFTTLLYLDKEAKLLKAVINNPNLYQLSAQKIIKIASKTIDDEKEYKNERQDSDSVKIKGGSKRAKITRFERRVIKKDEIDYYREVASVPTTDFYNKLAAIWKKEDLRDSLSKYLDKIYRSDRARNIHKILEYYFDHQNENITITQMSRDLKISQKSLSQILSVLRNDGRLLKVLSTLLL